VTKGAVDITRFHDEATGTVSLGVAIAELKVADAKARVLEVLEKFVADYWADATKIREAAELQRVSCATALKELIDEGAVESRGSGKRNDPFQYRLFRLPEKPDSFPTYMVGHESGNTSLERAEPVQGELIPDSVPPYIARQESGNENPEKKPDSFPTYIGRQESGNAEACSVCGRALTEEEKEGGTGVCLDCV